MRKRVLFGLAGGGIFAAGLLIGMLTNGFSVFASSGSPANTTTTSANGNYCQLYAQTLAHDLHVSTTQLQQANQDALQKVIDQMAADGTINATQKAKLEANLQKLSQRPCAFVGRFGRSAPGARYAQALAGARTQIESAVAGALRLPATTLDSDLASGQTISQIATAQHVALSTVNTAYLNAVKAALASAVSSHTITQPQSDTIYTKVQQAVASGHYPLLERGKMKAPPSQA